MQCCSTKALGIMMLRKRNSFHLILQSKKIKNLRSICTVFRTRTTPPHVQFGPVCVGLLHRRSTRFSTTTTTTGPDSASALSVDEHLSQNNLLPRNNNDSKAWWELEIEHQCSSGDPADAEQLLQKIEQEHRRRTKGTLGGTPGVAEQRPLVRYYNLILSKWVKMQKSDRAYALLSTMMTNADNNDGTTPDATSFNTVLAAIANTKDAEKAENLLNQMQDFAGRHPEAEPDHITLTSMVHILSSQGRAEEAIGVLKRMESSPNLRLRPDALTYTLVIQALAATEKTKKSHSRNKQTRRAIRRAGDRALELLNRLEERYRILESDVQPDTILCNAVLNVLAHAGDGKRAEALLQEMKRGFRGTQCYPSTVSYATVLLAWKNTKTREGAKHAEKLLWKIPKPNEVCFSTVISAWAQMGEAEKAETLLEHTRRWCRVYGSFGKDLGLNTISYAAVLEAWAVSGRPDAMERAERLLLFMETAGPEPNTICYNTLLKVMEKSSIDNKAQRAQTVLRRMGNVKPNVRTYNAIIATCAATRNDKEFQDALTIAFQTFRELRQSRHLAFDDYTYGTMMKACGNLNPKGRFGHAIVDQVFRWCCKDGKVDGLIMAHLRRACSENHLKELLHVENLSEESLKLNLMPEEWTRNNSFQNRGQHKTKRPQTKRK